MEGLVAAVSRSDEQRTFFGVFVINFEIQIQIIYLTKVVVHISQLIYML